MRYDLLIYNANIYTIDDKKDVYKNMLIKDGVVVRLIKEAYLPDDINIKTDVLNLLNMKGKTIAPAFIYPTPCLLGDFIAIDKSSDIYDSIDYVDLFNGYSKNEVMSLLVKSNDYFIKNGISTLISDFLKGELITDETYKSTYAFQKLSNLDVILPDKQDEKIRIKNESGINEGEAFPIDYGDVKSSSTPLKRIISMKNEHGMSTFNAYKALTYHIADYLHLLDLRGTLKEGSLANFLVFKYDIFNYPDENILLNSSHEMYVYGELVSKLN